MHVVILYNAVTDDASEADRDVLAQVQAVSEALTRLRHSWEVLPCTLNLEPVLNRLLDVRSAVVFQLVESLNGSDRVAVAATSLLDSLGMPYTGSLTESLVLANHKLLAKERLARAGLPTPSWIAPLPHSGRRLICAADRRPFEPGAAYVVKSVFEHASFGLDEKSVVSFAEEAGLSIHLAEHAVRLGRPCFAERYVDGREFNLSVLAGEDGPQILPAAEIEFLGFPPGKPRIVGERAKWDEASFECQNTVRRFDFPASDGPLLQRLTDLSRSCWNLFGLRGYVRVDFRVDHAGQPWILEINANPCISPDAGFTAALERAGVDYAEAIQRILDDAIV